MMRFLTMMALALWLPVCALAQLDMAQQNEGDNRLVVFGMQAAQDDKAPDPVHMAISTQIEVRFAQEKARQLAARAGASVQQTGSLYQDGAIASMGLVWQGDQADGTQGSTAAGLTVSLETGVEIYLDELFSDPQAAYAQMERIIGEEILEGMSDYMEYSELLPMPRNSFSVNEQGLTIYYPQERYRYYSGEAGSVLFRWHELEAYIGESSPVYALSRGAAADADALRSLLAQGRFEELPDAGLGDLLGDVCARVALADPDYTRDGLVYPLERVRGFAVEIPKYADTPEEETPVSVVRASCISCHGLITGKTTPDDLRALLGEPTSTLVYEEEAALDALLEPGESLFYESDGRVLQAHFDSDGLLSCLMLRSAMPVTFF